MGCTSPINGSLNIVGGGGGPSHCIDLVNGACLTPFTGSNLTGYPKPSWQPVATGSGLTVQNDLTRDVPDISLFASEGSSSNSFYIVCQADEPQQNGSCSTTRITGFIGVGGTSSAAPTFAGIMALVNEKMASLSLAARQGNANYVLYPLAATQRGLALMCDSSNGPSALCTFHDITRGNISVPCAGGSPNCSSGTQNTTGILDSNTSSAAWNAGAGFDLATGLGTMNVTNLINNWSTQIDTFTPTSTTLCLVLAPATTCASLPGALTITHGQQVNVTIGIAPNPPASALALPEDVSLIGTYAGGSTAAVDRFDPGNNVDIYSLGAGGQVSASTKELLGGSYSVKAHYAGDGHFGSSDSNAINVTVMPESSVSTACVRGRKSHHLSNEQRVPRFLGLFSRLR